MKMIETNSFSVFGGNAEFDSNVQASKDKAVEALSQSKDIEALIIEAESRTQEARSALSGAESDAIDARDTAKAAQETAQQASAV